MKEITALGYERVPSGRILALLAEGIMPAAGPSRDQIRRLVLQESDATPAQVEHFFKTWPTEKLLRIIWDFPDRLPAPIPPVSKISAALDDDRPLADLLARIAAWNWPSQQFGELGLGDCSSDGCAIASALTVAGLVDRRRETGLATGGRSMATVSIIVSVPVASQLHTPIATKAGGRLPIAAQPISGRSGHGRACWWPDTVANDPRSDLAADSALLITGQGSNRSIQPWF